ncbi:hypothetical protein FQ087_11385 [Sporosarcina sp. ANT_H38]|uniref:DUF6470 family protein n=1 Tax=Sporosarcina sp. ANT_H38 TaxID=2597358 RepID=UPI0011F15D9C|nr:DUF6470 family protein [Sporosarcina sp. ANT_H38]KAA0966792.1 hypothetical protein FQ087_11385 [Sporosarcina sp. ANT_H38]
MNIPQLQIQTTRGILGLQITKPTQEIEQPRATMNIQQPAAILEISSTRPQLSIDTTEARADIDMKSVRRRIEEHAQLGMQGASEGTARRAQEGQQMLRIENGGKVIADIAKQNATPPPAPLGIRFVGNRSNVQISAQAGTTNIQATPQKPIIDVQINKPIHNYTPGKVSGVMEQYPSIQIDVKW